MLRVNPNMTLRLEVYTVQPLKVNISMLIVAVGKTEIKPQDEQLIITSAMADGTKRTKDIPLSNMDIDTITTFITPTSVAIINDGECFVRLTLISNGVLRQLFCQDYLTNNNFVNYPNSQIKSSSNTLGFQKSITISADATDKYSIDSTIYSSLENVLVKVNSIQFDFLTSGYADVRYITYSLLKSGNLLFSQNFPFIYTTSTRYYHWLAPNQIFLSQVWYSADKWICKDSIVEGFFNISEFRLQYSSLLLGEVLSQLTANFQCILKA
jgi:hypothetical protein